MPSLGKLSLVLSMLVAGALALSGCASPAGGVNPLPPIASAEYRVDAGDKLHVEVQDLKDASADYIVDETGAISLPMVKNVPVRGLSYREVATAIEDALRSHQILLNPKVSVQPLELRPFYIMGEVGKPGEYPYRQGMTVFSAVSVAGGYTYRAKSDSVVITRTIGGKTVTGSATEKTYILPGDRIRVYERWF